MTTVTGAHCSNHILHRGAKRERILPKDNSLGHKPTPSSYPVFSHSYLDWRTQIGDLEALLSAGSLPREFLAALALCQQPHVGRNSVAVHDQGE